ncbi:4923_t:CDS:2 [Paraglomus brasilianum]|uniref:4923_t:CDS:1 n=1 Tax=Paraglomus brasilianum TaxID=144538 RepID=A0A9N9CI29_9GLOM|nr:4923_t:CDS:2 [Paraglomus brasilianum]
MIEVKGSTLSPNKLDSDIGIAPLEKFIFTICDIEHTLEDDYGFKREKNGEIRFILFVDEADLDTGQLQHFDGKFASPKPPKIEDVVEKTIAKVDETLAIRLEEVNNRISEIREEISSRGGEYVGTLNLGITQITGMLAEIGKKI